MSHTIDEFTRMWNAPNTMHLIGTTIAVCGDAEGAKLLLHHGGTTQAIELDRQQADDLAAALTCLQSLRHGV